MSWMTDLPPALAKALKAETQGELVAWAAQPHAFRTFAWTTPIWLFGIPWTAFSLFAFGALAAGPLSGADIPASLGTGGLIATYVGMIFMIPFVLIGLAIMATPFWTYAKARRTVYAITDKRLIILTEGRSRKVQGIEPAFVRMITRTEKPDGTGTLKITLGFEKDSDGDTVEKDETIRHVAGVRRAEQLLQALRQKTKV